MLSAYFDDRDPKRQSETRRFWEALEGRRVVVSDLTIAELARTPSLHRRGEFLALAGTLESLATPPEAYALAAQYQAELPEVWARDDFLHAAAATLLGASVLVSWNRRHLANARTRAAVARVNSRTGHHRLEIRTPFEEL